LGFMICTAMSGNGVKMSGTTITSARQLMAQLG
jgi:hypothetical protein